MRSLIALAVFHALTGTTLRAQDNLYVREAGPGEPGRILRAALAGAHTVLRPDSSPLVFPRGDVVPSTLIVLGADVKVGAMVNGSIVVIGGDLFVHPGAHVTGRAVAFGGGVYSSTLAIVEGGVTAFRDATFDTTATSLGVALDYRDLNEYRPPAARLPGLYGARIPTYDRVNGLQVPWGPLFALGARRLELDPTLTYRSHIGAIDPRLALRAMFGRRTRIDAALERGTFTNDGWIRSDLMNTLSSLALGADVRNYYRADRMDVRVTRLWEGRTWTAAPFVGALTERAWSVGSAVAPTSAPWSAFGRRDVLEGMLRPNPRVAHGRITSAIGGVTGAWGTGGVELSLRALLEMALENPGSSEFMQTTVQGSVEFPTFGTQKFESFVHAVISSREPPPQRYAYLGGSGTLPTFMLLEFGGDELFFAEAEYIVPIDPITIRYLGTPAVSLRYMIGAAGVGTLPALEQNLGVRLRLSLVRVDYVIEPVDGASDFSVGLSLFR